MNPASEPQSTAATPLVVLLFLATRAVLFTNFQLGSDIQRVYSKPVLEIEQAARHGISFYDFHEQHIQKRIDRKRREGKPPLPDEMKLVEYPPLAILVMYLPKLVAGEAAEEELDHPGPVIARYIVAYRVQMAIVDVLIFAFLAYRIPRLFREETSPDHQERLLIYVLAGAVLGNLLYDRLDLVLGGLVLLAMALLASRAHYFWSFLVLALAVNYKLVPVVLFPVWVLLSLRPGTMSRLSRLVAACMGRSLLLIGLTVCLTVPFLLMYGERCLEFLSYHQQRGMETNAVPSSLLLLAAAFGYPVQLHWGHGAYELTASLAPFLGWFSTGLMAALLLAAAVLLGLTLLRKKPDLQVPARRDPALLTGYTLLFLMTTVAASKAFSPQYLLWLLPLVPLAPLPNRPRRWFQWGFVGLAILTTAIFPYLYLYIRLLYPHDEYPIPPISGNLALASGSLVVLRNLVFVALTALLWAFAWHGKFAADQGEGSGFSSNPRSTAGNTFQLSR